MPYADKDKKAEYYQKHKKFYERNYKIKNKEAWNRYQAAYKRNKRAAKNKPAVTNFSIDEIRSMIREMNLDAEDSLSFKAGVILIYISQTADFGIKSISENCGFNYDEVFTIMLNLRNNKIITQDNKFNLDMNQETAWMEFILVCLAGGGELVRVQTNTL